MLDVNDFSKRQIVVYAPAIGDKISYKNDNIIISDKKGKIKYQYTCYRIFMLIIVGDVSITTGILRRAKKFGFSICFFTYSLRLYGIMESSMQGNTYLRQKQYKYQSSEIGRILIYNKVLNQRQALKSIRKKTADVEEGIEKLAEYLKKLSKDGIERETILGYEGNASRIYFARVFNNCKWKSRKPRVKADYINSLLDIGYSLLFNFIDAILQVFGFDVYQGVLHTCFYMRKSLVCDIMEPFRPIIDLRIRKGINLHQFKEDDFLLINGQWQLQYSKSTSYTAVFMKDILEHKDEIFIYIRTYYRSFMKEYAPEKMPIFDISQTDIVNMEECEYDFD